MREFSSGLPFVRSRVKLFEDEVLRRCGRRGPNRLPFGATRKWPGHPTKG